jgi:hypothetical protein
MFPLSLIPVFAVPLSILLHFASLQKLRQEQKSGYRTLPTPGTAASAEVNPKGAFSIQR